MSREPAVIIGAVATLLSAAYGYFFAGAEESLKVHEFLMALVPIVAALLTRSQVTPTSS